MVKASRWIAVGVAAPGVGRDASPATAAYWSGAEQ